MEKVSLESGAEQR